MTLFFLCVFPLKSFAGIEDFGPGEPYISPPYVSPLPPPPSKQNLVDNDDGTITDFDSRLMWTKVDSYAALGRCLNYKESVDYVKNLGTAGYSDWRLPTVKELLSIFDLTKNNFLGWDRDPAYPLALDKKFSPGAAYLFWSSNVTASQYTDCCAKSVYFVNGMVRLHRLTMCLNSGVRAVRNLR